MRPPTALRHIARRSPRRQQQGSVVLFFLLFLTALLSFGAFAINVAHVDVVRNEMQNAADAAALAGAGALLGSAAGPTWTSGQTAALGAIGLNASDGQVLSSGTVQTGYWNLSGTPSGLQAQTITPGPYDVPAVQVTVDRANGVNGGPVAMVLGKLLNLLSVPIGATAVAVVAAPGTVGAGGLFPVALDQCIFDQYWNSSTNQPRLDPSTGQPYEFQITNGYAYGSSDDGSDCSAGQWTSFLVNADNVPTIRDLMANGNPSPLSIGDSIWIEPGAKTTLYSSVPVGTTVVIPVATQISAKTYVTIVAFAAFHIDASVGGSGKYIQGHFVSDYQIPSSASGNGPNYGAYVAPRLAL